uniref:Autophagy-related protein 101 n=1 Tax=Timema tahoe TaxID=61484 RepID=A0A7R9IPN1_9NEOP|nr:unnamed protein product [Timema tahoe]
MNARSQVFDLKSGKPCWENHVGKTTLSTFDQDSNPDLLVTSSLVHHESDALDHAATEAGGWMEEGWEMVSGGGLVYWVWEYLYEVGSSSEGSYLRMSAKSQFIWDQGIVLEGRCLGSEGILGLEVRRVLSDGWEAKAAVQGLYLRERETEAASKLRYLSSLEGRQVDEAVSSIFHTVLFHRSLGKFRYKQEGSYSVGTIGYEDVDCDFIDFTYVCCSSVHLDRSLKGVINEFSEVLRGNDGPGTGQISLEFFQKKKNRWPFQTENIPWEVWTIRLELIKLNNEHERQVCREKVGDMLTDKIIYIAEVMNRHEYVPKMPNQSELDLIFDTTFPDVQPYLFKIIFNASFPFNVVSNSLDGNNSSLIELSSKNPRNKLQDLFQMIQILYQLYQVTFSSSFLIFLQSIQNADRSRANCSCPKSSKQGGIPELPTDDGITDKTTGWWSHTACFVCLHMFRSEDTATSGAVGHFMMRCLFPPWFRSVEPLLWDDIGITSYLEGIL